jgi:hypothetical protein
MKTPAHMEELYQVLQNIRRGDGVPEVHYRAGIDRDRDALLEVHGIMHLHLGGRDSDVLVFLIQYIDRIVLLESNTHIHFRTQPAGKNILALSQSWLDNLEREMREAAAQSASAEIEAERREADARVARIADSIAAFKRKTGLE